MAHDWETFKNEWAMIQYETALFNLSFLEQKFQSPIERVMFWMLATEFEDPIKTGTVELVPQKTFGKYRVDFYLSYISEKNEKLEFIIECDGHNYHERTKEQAQHDKKRDRFFTENGYIVLRYTGSEIFKNYKKLTSEIWSLIVRKDGVI